MNQPWYYQSWIIVPLLFLCFPIGLILMWKGKRYSLITRCAISGILGIIWLAAIVSSSKEQSKTIHSPAVQVVSQTQSEAQSVEPTPTLSHEEKIKKIADCNARYMDSNSVKKKKNPSSGIDVDILKKAINDPNYGEAEQKAQNEAALKKAQGLDALCMQLYGEIYDRNRANWREAERQTEIRIPNAFSSPAALKQSEQYEDKLNKQFETQLLADYKITLGQFQKINDIVAPLKEHEQRNEAETLNTELTDNSAFGKKLIKLEVLPQIDGSRFVRAYFRTTDSSNEEARRDIIESAMKFAEQIFTSSETNNVARIEVRAQASLIDKYGNAGMDEVGLLSIERRLAEKINWQNITPDMFEKLLSSNDGGFMRLHPAFNKK